MKKNFLLLATAFLASSSYTIAQTSPGNKVRYGIRAGINVASFSTSSERKADDKEEGYKSKPVVSFHLGGYADYALSKNFSIQAGLSLSGKGGKSAWSEDDLDGSASGEGSFKESLLYLEVPVNAIYRSGSFYFGAGPCLGFALSGKWKESYEYNLGNGDTESGTESGKIEFSGEDGYFKRADFGVNFLAGYQLNNNISLAAGYGLGLPNLFKTDDAEARKYWAFKNRVFSVSVSYSF